MRNCKYSGNICRTEELMRQSNKPEIAEELVAKYCYDKKENCSQYRFLEDSGIGFGYDLSKLIDSAKEVLDRIRRSG